MLADQERHGGNWMNDGYLSSHGVNVAMGLKAMPVWWRHDPSADQQPGCSADRAPGRAPRPGQRSVQRRRAPGRPPPEPGHRDLRRRRVPRLARGRARVLGRGRALADRLERLAFNALPASTSPDKWTHQYVQQANQVVCHVTEDRIYTNNGPTRTSSASNPTSAAAPPTATRAGPASPPTSGCAPSRRRPHRPLLRALLLRVRRPERCDVSGAYPFEDDVTIRVTGSGVVPLQPPDPGLGHRRNRHRRRVREAARPGTIHEIRRDWSGDHSDPSPPAAEVQAVRRLDDAITLERGPLVFSLAIGEDWRQVGGEPPHATWEVHPTTAWNYAIDPSAHRVTRHRHSSNPSHPHSAARRAGPRPPHPLAPGTRRRGCTSAPGLPPPTHLSRT